MVFLRGGGPEGAAAAGGHGGRAAHGRRAARLGPPQVRDGACTLADAHLGLRAAPLTTRGRGGLQCCIPTYPFFEKYLRLFSPFPYSSWSTKRRSAHGARLVGHAARSRVELHLSRFLNCVEMINEAPHTPSMLRCHTKKIRLPSVYMK